MVSVPIERTVENSDFKFKVNDLNQYELELPFFEHIEELRQRSFQVLGLFLIITLLLFVDVKLIVKLLEVPVQDIRFFQISPGEYFLSTVKIACYSGLLFCSPVLLSQIILFILPGLNSNEKKIILPLLIGSIILFGTGLLFSYYVLIPAALNFFISYSADVVEPLWSIDQYFDFILLIFLTTGLAFQIPVFQIILGLLNVISGKQMLEAWKYVVLGSTIVGAILTPSTDPITQIFLSSAIMLLYLSGAGVLILLKK
jgi:sec-independent protein translocase protein TatC